MASDMEKNGSYTEIDVGLSVKKEIKYCDFVGFKAKYTDPKTGIRYCNSEYYPLIERITDGVKE